MNKVKRFFFDFWNLPRRDFYVKYFLPFILIIFSWFLIGGLVEMNYEKANLNQISGYIIGINETLVSDYKSQHSELRIYLNNYPKYFRITDNYKYQNFIENLRLGDKILIYYRPIYLVPIGAGRQTDIYQLECKNKILFDLKNRKRNSKGLIIISSISLLFFGIFYYFARKRLIDRSIS